jgi:formate dehydrogenase assembly factor FdhD
MTYLVVGIDHATLAPWHQNIAARTVARAAREAVQRAAAAGIELVVAAVIGANSTVLAHPIGKPVARVRAA